MTHLPHIFDIRMSLPTSLTLEQQRTKWLMEFLKTYAVLVIVYGGFYLLRTNFKSTQPFLVEQIGLTTIQLGTIGFVLSLTYDFGGLILGFFIDGKNTKKAISTLLLASDATSVLIGLMLVWFHSPYGWMILPWSLNGLFQAPGGPCCNSTMNQWAPRALCGCFIGWWNASHDVDAMVAGALVLWGANTLFNGSVIGVFIVPAVICIPIDIWGWFFNKDGPKEHGWSTSEAIFGEPESKADAVISSVSKGRTLLDYVVKNPAVWFLCAANVAVYCMRISIDNWSVLYTRQEFGLSDYLTVNTTIALELGGPAGSLLRGYFSDEIGGRCALSAAIGMGTVVIPFSVYAHVMTILVIYGALFMIGFFIFGPVTLIGTCVIGFVSKATTVVVNAVPRAFGYASGDSMAKVLLGRTADPVKDNVTVPGLYLHGRSLTFTALLASAAVSLACPIMVAFFEERNLCADCEFSEAKEES